MDTSDLKQVQRRLGDVSTASSTSKAALTDDIMDGLTGSGGPYKLLSKMSHQHVRAFMEENWVEIEKANRPAECGYSDRAAYKKETCMLFILWAWHKML